MIIQINNNTGLSNLQVLALVTSKERTWPYQLGEFYQDDPLKRLRITRQIKIINDLKGDHAAVLYSISPLPNS